ncbi:hypothetical protein FA95DRAFT_1495156, partial [Auriscalpium vulgare]
TSHGTTNMYNNAKRCDEVRGIRTSSSDTTDTIPYSPAAHRAVIALRSATSQRPFNMVADKYYAMEVNMLRPGTPLPAPTTVSEDIKALHVGLASDVKEYFSVSFPSHDLIWL